MILALALAWLAPLALGCALVALAEGRPRGPGAWMRVTGCGSVLGLLACACAVGSSGLRDPALLLPVLAPVLLLVANIAAWLARRRTAAPLLASDARLHPLAVGLLLLLAWHGWLILTEVSLRTPYPWDAWAIWLLKPRAWMLGGHMDTFVGFEQWLAHPEADLRTAAAWDYPEAVAHVGIWLAAAWGEWNGVVVTAAWAVLWVALLLGIHGHLRGLGLAPTRALLATYVLGSMPLVNVHVALAGYADLWIAATLAFASLAWLRWLHWRRPGDLLLALAFAMLLPTIKREGAVWLLVLGISILYSRLGPRARRIAWALGPLAALGLVLTWPPQWPPRVPTLDGGAPPGRFGGIIAHAPTAAAAFASGLFAQENWHLLWPAFVFSLVVRWRVLTDSAPLRFYALFLLLGAAFLVLLFVLTPAARWSESHTVVNRLVMHLVPCAVAFAALLWREPVPEQSGDARSGSNTAGESGGMKASRA
ncbi:MAG: hypothetical protein J0H15_10715 [Xanthomonadales bacterium]|nr:hypothetical protein [Xanthomonadales bacterium]